MPPSATQWSTSPGSWSGPTADARCAVHSVRYERCHGELAHASATTMAAMQAAPDAASVATNRRMAADMAAGDGRGTEPPGEGANSRADQTSRRSGKEITQRAPYRCLMPPTPSDDR